MKNESLNNEMMLNPLYNVNYSLKRQATSIKPVALKRHSLIEINHKVVNEINKENNFREKLLIKIKKNTQIILTFSFIFYVYAVYLFLFIVPLLYASNRGLDYRFWYFLDDDLYRKGFSYFLMLHLLLGLVIYSMAVSMFTDSGTIDKEYLKYFDLLNNFDKTKIQDIRIRNGLNRLINERRSSNIKISKNEDKNLNDNYNPEEYIDNIPITMDSFHNMFNTELPFDINEEMITINDYKNKNTNSLFENLVTNQKKLKYFTSKEFFYKFYYYTREMTLEKIKENKNYCVFCKIIRPERSHHCKECRKCVLKMDHHCGILNTCVGFYNYKPWVVFVFYSTFILLFLLVSMMDGINFYFNKDFYGIETWQCKVFCITFILVLVAFISVSELFITHLLYISRGVSTIEDKSKNFMEQLTKAPDSRGFTEHLIEINGSNLNKMFLPLNKKFGVYNGYIWLNDKNYLDYVNESRQNYLRLYEHELLNGKLDGGQNVPFEFIEDISQNDNFNSENQNNNEIDNLLNNQHSNYDSLIEPL